ncbi:DUF3368 domain-containing protein [Candidatus Woesearchaeota archaeon]|nr:DUF3368 domain-containing protein [Candidatus Woesearchaeota archaeon]
MRFVFDSGPLIYLGKTRVLEHLRNLATECIIPEQVYNEVVRAGKDLGKDDALYIDSLIKEGIFVVQDSSKVFDASHPTLSLADQEVLHLAKESKAIAVIDEDIGRATAEVLGVSTKGSIGILLVLVNNRILSKKECQAIVLQMIDHGWYCSTDLYSLIMEKVR